MAELSLGTLYDFNKQAMAKEQPLAELELEQKLNKVAWDICTKHYWMLLCNERRDYTVFNILNNNVEFLKSELCDTLKNRGEILSIDKQEDGSFEIWIRDPESKENFAYYLFDYCFGVVEI